MDKAKKKKLRETLNKIEKNFGPGSVMLLGDAPLKKIDIIPTGSIGLDRALGIGGYPKGRTVEIYGPEASGKTTLALHAIAECQAQGGSAAFIDVEYALDTHYAANLGVNVDELLVSQPGCGEEALEITENLISDGVVDIVVVDSVAALVPRTELEGEVGDLKMGLQARLMSQCMRKMTAATYQSNTCCMFLNQLRNKIGVLYGSPEVTTGGNALKYYASVRLDIRRSTQLKDGEEILGNLTRVKVVKNKLAPPFKKVEFDIIYGEGISRIGEVLDYGVAAGIIQKSGSWYSYEETKLGQGRGNTLSILKDNPELTKEIEEKL